MVLFFSRKFGLFSSDIKPQKNCMAVIIQLNGILRLSFSFISRSFNQVQANPIDSIEERSYGISLKVSSAVSIAMYPY